MLNQSLASSAPPPPSAPPPTPPPAVARPQALLSLLANYTVVCERDFERDFNFDATFPKAQQRHMIYFRRKGSRKGKLTQALRRAVIEAQ